MTLKPKRNASKQELHEPGLKHGDSSSRNDYINDLEERVVVVKTAEGIHTPAKRRGRKSLLNTSVQ